MRVFTVDGNVYAKDTVQMFANCERVEYVNWTKCNGMIFINYRWKN